MILRRLTQHVKEQNWFAVFLDFIIVVVGVFLGIQIGNWNAEAVLDRKADKLERNLVLEMAGEAVQYRIRLVYFQDVQTNGEALLADIEGPTAPDTLSDEDFIIKAFRATQYNTMRKTRYAFDEIVGAGIGDLLDDQDLMRAAELYYALSWVDVAVQDTQTSSYRRLFRETVPLDVQRDARQQCGDVNAAPFDTFEAATVMFEPDAVALDYPCELSLSPERIAAAAKALREAEGLELALRLRIAEMDNTNALIASVDEEMSKWRMTPDEFARALKDRGEL